MNVTIVDYGVGNLASVRKALAFVGGSPVTVTDAEAIGEARAIVIPGVGHFAATRALNVGWRDSIASAVARGIPVLGICLGMQWLFEGSAEAPGTPGLGVFAGISSELGGDVKVPHVGWNTLDRTNRASILLDGINRGAAAYFTHSFAAPVTGDTVATTTYGEGFASVVERGRVFGAQWHPEKSGLVGVTALRNFVAFAREVSC